MEVQSKPTLYICGDSFCSPDPDYGPCWVDLLIEQRTDLDIVNLASPGASNYLIALQIEQALNNNCDYLIYHATSSIRQEFSCGQGVLEPDNLQRYWTPISKQNKTVMSGSWMSINRNNDVFNQQDQKIVLDFFAKYIDFPSQIKKNYFLIDYALEKISRHPSLKNWVWSQGGFEHPKFGGHGQWNFSKFALHESAINLWDDFDRDLWRPWYHITDISVHKQVCEHYQAMLQLQKL